MPNPLQLRGLWLPLITPFNRGALDLASLRRMVRHYAAQPIDGFVLAATTGESLTLEPQEIRALADTVADEQAAIGSSLPVLLGLSGSDTRALLQDLAETAGWPIQGSLIACPYYTRPPQHGLVQHFTALADAARHPIVIYNIPYRTGVNLLNEAMLQLAAHPRIQGVKDCCAEMAQSFDLLCRKPRDFAVLTGEDGWFYGMLAHGAEGGITASAHIRTGDFARLRQLLLAGDQPGALALWRDLAALPRLLFAEPSPAPIKHWLWRQGLIDSPELRLPMAPVSATLAARIDACVRTSRPC